MEENKELPEFIFKFQNEMSEEDKRKTSEKLKKLFKGSIVFFVEKDFEMLQLNDIYKKII